MDVLESAMVLYLDVLNDSDGVPECVAASRVANANKLEPICSRDGHGRFGAAREVHARIRRRGAGGKRESARRRTDEFERRAIAKPAACRAGERYDHRLTVRRPKIERSAVAQKETDERRRESYLHVGADRAVHRHAPAPFKELGSGGGRRRVRSNDVFGLRRAVLVRPCDGESARAEITGRVDRNLASASKATRIRAARDSHAIEHKRTRADELLRRADTVAIRRDRNISTERLDDARFARRDAGHSWVSGDHTPIQTSTEASAPEMAVSLAQTCRHGVTDAKPSAVPDAPESPMVPSSTPLLPTPAVGGTSEPYISIVAVPSPELVSTMA